MIVLNIHSFYLVILVNKIGGDFLDDADKTLNEQFKEMVTLIESLTGDRTVTTNMTNWSHDNITTKYDEFLRYYDVTSCPKSGESVGSKYVKRHVLKGLVVNSTVGDTHWHEYKSVFNKSYSKQDREHNARRAWTSNLQLVANHNRAYLEGKHTYSLHLNHFADMDSSQFKTRVTRLIKGRIDHEVPRGQVLGKRLVVIPQELDWRQRGYKPKLEEQWRCGACYAFAVAHATQAQLCRKQTICPDLSVQQIVDCSGIEGNLGCGGGSLGGSMRYIKSFGLQRETEYPYLGKLGRCGYNALLVKARPRKWGILPPGDEAALERTLAMVGPLAIAINAGPTSFQLYRSGVYDDPLCSANELNHAMLLIGYTKDYWILMNWWGPNWGEDGYMRIKRGLNRCGIANSATYVEL